MVYKFKILIIAIFDVNSLTVSVHLIVFLPLYSCNFVSVCIILLFLFVIFVILIPKCVLVIIILEFDKYFNN